MEKNELTVFDEARKSFEMACQEAQSLQLIDNFGAAFSAVTVIARLRECLTDDVMNKVFMPIMNTKLGFLTDRTGKPNRKGETKPLYTIPVVRNCVIEAVTIGLLPTQNQFNIIAERMYPTKEGYTALLRRLGVKYVIDVGSDTSDKDNEAEIKCQISYEYKGEKNSFSIKATLKKDQYSSHDLLRGKAERRAKKSLYEYITGCDYGEADERSSVVDADFVDVTDEGPRKAISANQATATATNQQTLAAASPDECPI